MGGKNTCKPPVDQPALPPVTKVVEPELAQAETPPAAQQQDCLFFQPVVETPGQDRLAVLHVATNKELGRFLSHQSSAEAWLYRIRYLRMLFTALYLMMRRNHIL